MKAGLAKVDITPRIGVELQGYGAYLNRHSDGIRDRLYARALAFEVNGEKAVLVSCDVIAVSKAITEAAREQVRARSGLAPERVMVHATHTHSGPSVPVYIGWGQPDAPYVENLPCRLAEACCQAMDNLQEARLSLAEVPCEGIAMNREFESYGTETAEEPLDDSWRPQHPEWTDRTCHVLRFDTDQGLLGFCSYFGCHPVIGGPSCRKIHGDYPGLATNLVERLHPGSIGLFLQGASGDINPCRVTQSETECMRLLDTVAARYARSVLNGLQEAAPVDVPVLEVVQRQSVFSRKDWDRAKLLSLVAEQEAILHRPHAPDEESETRLAMVKLIALRGFLAGLDAGQDLSPPLELQGIRLGPVAFLGTPFEVQRAIKEDVLAGASSPVPLVMGMTNNCQGYAVERRVAERGGYAADLVPFIAGHLPYANIHDELASELLALDHSL